MQFPKLDEETKKAVNELTIEEIGLWTSPLYNKELLQSGIDSIAIIYLMKMAGDLSNEKMTRKDFIEKYNINFEKRDYGFTVPLNKIESDGIFIPAQAYWNSRGKRTERNVWFFDARYRERLLWRDSWKDLSYLMCSWDRKLTSGDLADPILIAQGAEFGKIIWKISVEKFYINKEDTLQPQKVTELGEKLIEYYSKIITAIENSQ